MQLLAALLKLYVVHQTLLNAHPVHVLLTCLSSNALLAAGMADLRWQLMWPPLPSGTIPPAAVADSLLASADSQLLSSHIRACACCCCCCAHWSPAQAPCRDAAECCSCRRWCCCLRHLMRLAPPLLWLLLLAVCDGCAATAAVDGVLASSCHWLLPPAVCADSPEGSDGSVGELQVTMGCRRPACIELRRGLVWAIRSHTCSHTTDQQLQRMFGASLPNTAVV